MKNILTIDASTKRTGIAWIDEEEKVHYEVISSAAAAVEKRISIMKDRILEIIKENRIKTVILEDIRIDLGNSHTTKVLAWLQGVVAVSIFEFDKNIEIDFFPPTSWRSKLGIQGSRVKRTEQKKIDIEYANKAFGLNLAEDQDDEADALCLLAAKLKGYGKEVCELPVSQRPTFSQKNMGSN